MRTAIKHLIIILCVVIVPASLWALAPKFSEETVKDMVETGRALVTHYGKDAVLVNRLVKEGAYKGSIGLDIVEILKQVSPKRTALILTDMYKKADEEDVDKVFDWMVERLAGDSRLTARSIDDMSVSAKILRDMGEIPGNIIILKEIFDPIKTKVDLHENILGLHKELFNNVDKIVDWETFMETGKVFVYELQIPERDKMEEVWQKKLGVTWTDPGSVKDAARALGKLAVKPGVSNPLFEHFCEMEKILNSENIGIPEKNYIDYIDALIDGLLISDTKSLARKFVKHDPIDAIRPDVRQRLFMKLGRDKRMEFMIEALRKGDVKRTPDLLRKNFTTGDLLEKEKELIVPLVLHHYAWLGMSPKSQLMKFKRDLGELSEEEKKSINIAIRDTFIELYINPVKDRRSGLYDHELKAFLNYLYFMEREYITLDSKHMNFLNKILQATRGAFGRIHPFKAHTDILEHIKIYPSHEGRNPRYDLRARWVYGNMIKVEERDELRERYDAYIGQYLMRDADDRFGVFNKISKLGRSGFFYACEYSELVSGNSKMIVAPMIITALRVSDNVEEFRESLEAIDDLTQKMVDAGIKKPAKLMEDILPRTARLSKKNAGSFKKLCGLLGEYVKEPGRSNNPELALWGAVPLISRVRSIENFKVGLDLLRELDELNMIYGVPFIAERYRKPENFHDALVALFKEKHVWDLTHLSNARDGEHIYEDMSKVFKSSKGLNDALSTLASFFGIQQVIYESYLNGDLRQIEDKTANGKDYEHARTMFAGKGILRCEYSHDGKITKIVAVQLDIDKKVTEEYELELQGSKMIDDDVLVIMETDGSL